MNQHNSGQRPDIQEEDTPVLPPPGRRHTGRERALGLLIALLIVVLPVGTGAAIIAITNIGIAKEQRIQAALTLFEKHFAAEELDAAEQELQKAKTIRSDHPRVKEAEKKLSHALALATRYKQGREFLTQKQWSSAIETLAPIKDYKDAKYLLMEARYEVARAAMAAKQWAEARRLLEALPPTYRDVQFLLQQVTREEASEKSRAALREVEQWLAVYARKKEVFGTVLETKKSVLEIEERLQAVNPKYLSPAERQRYRTVSARFRQVHSKVEAEIRAATRSVAIAARQEFAEQYERRLLNGGLDVYITLEGPEKTTMRIKYVLWSRPLVYKFINDEIIAKRFRELGFKKLIFDTGFGERWTWDIK